MSTAWNVAPPLKANRELAFKTSLLASVFSGLIFASPAWAQETVAQSGASADAGAPDVMSNANGATEADASAQAANVGGMEEIVVTAQKRSESLQKVPIAISALGTEALETRGFDNLSSLSKLSPSIQLSNFGPYRLCNTARNWKREQHCRRRPGCGISL
jgi:outer membrane receptor protein involved in Fe transport